MAHYDLLTNPINCAYAVNVELTKEQAHIGAFYLEPHMPGNELPLESGSVRVKLLLPEELTNQAEAYRAWNIKLEVKEEEEEE